MNHLLTGLLMEPRVQITVLAHEVQNRNDVMMLGRDWEDEGVRTFHFFVHIHLLRDGKRLVRLEETLEDGEKGWHVRGDLYGDGQYFNFFMLLMLCLWNGITLSIEVDMLLPTFWGVYADNRERHTHMGRTQDGRIVKVDPRSNRSILVLLLKLSPLVH